MSHQQIDYVTLIRRQGYRMTPQRQAVLDAVCEGGGHTGIDAIVQRVHARDPSINLSTIYRTLDFLVDLHLILRAEMGGMVIYEIAHRDHHHHLICEGCGQEIEISQTALQPAFDQIQLDHRFQVKADHLVLTGMCARCQQEIGRP